MDTEIVERKARGVCQHCGVQFDSSNNYRKVIRFGDEALKNELVGYVDQIKERNRAARLEASYNEALKLMKNAGSDDNQYRVAGERFAQLDDYRDSKKLSEECLEKSLVYQYKHIISATHTASTSKQFKEIADRFARMGDYKDAPELSRKYYEKAKLKTIEEENNHRDSMYNHACEMQARDTVEDLRNAISIFKSLSNWRDSAEHIRICENRIEQLEKLNKIKSTFNPSITATQSASGTNCEAHREEKRKALKAKRNRNILIGIVLWFVPYLVIVSFYLFYKAYKYHQEMKNL